MKTLFILCSFVIILSNCEAKNNDKKFKNISDKIKSKKDSVISKEYKIKDLDEKIPNIELSDKDSVDFIFNSFSNLGGDFLNLNESKIFESKYLILNDLYNLNRIKKGLTLKTSNNIEISEIYYEKESIASSVFENLKKQVVNKSNEFEKGNYFFDYFDRCTIYLLINNKIVTIIYYPSVYPKTDTMISSILMKSKDKFKSVIRIYRIGDYENIK